MKYMIQIEISAEVGVDLDMEQVDKAREMRRRWDALNPIAVYNAMNRRAITVILDVPSPETFMNALHET